MTSDPSDGTLPGLRPVSGADWQAPIVGVLDLSPTGLTRFRVGAPAFVLAPIALVSIMASLGSILSWAARGQPLSSTEGVVGLTLGTLMLALIGASATRTSWGLAMVTAWSALLLAALTGLHLLGLSVHSLAVLAPSDSARILLLQLVGPAIWSGMPTLIFTISLCGTVAASLARAQRRLELHPEWPRPPRIDPGFLNGDADWFAAPGAPMSRTRTRAHLMVLAVDLLLGVAAWFCLLSMAPTDVSGVAVYGPLALSFQTVRSLPMLGLVVIFALLTLSTAWSTLGNLCTSCLVMILPGLLLIPSLSSLAGTVAAPGAPLATAAALAAPVMACYGLVSLSLTVGIHWVRTAPQAGD